jgi:hypothetical protein
LIAEVFRLAEFISASCSACRLRAVDAGISGSNREYAKIIQLLECLERR